MRVDESKAFAFAAAVVSAAAAFTFAAAFISAAAARTAFAAAVVSASAAFAFAAAAFTAFASTASSVSVGFCIGSVDRIRSVDASHAVPATATTTATTTPLHDRVVSSSSPAAYAPVANCSDALSCAVRDEVFPSGDVTSMASLVHAPGAAAVSAAFSGRHTTVSRFDAPGASAKAPHGWT